MVRQPPITDEDLTILMGGLRRFQRVVLAVSGGPDSMALLHLVARWRQLAVHGVPVIDVATVDHVLRPQSWAEAEWVASHAKALGLSHHILTWHDEKPRSGIQDAARAARYELLANFAASSNAAPVAVVTAHTMDDQAETLLMRLARGSGVDGLSSMRSERTLNRVKGIFLLRPLLGQPKSRLLAEVEAHGGAYLDDPSNANEQFERVRLRYLEPRLREAGLSAPMLALSARRLARARDALEAATCDFADRVLDVNGGAFARIDTNLFQAGAEELRVRLLSRVLRAFGGVAPAASLAQVETLVENLAKSGGVRQTLGGCVVRACSNKLHVFREIGRVVLPEITLERDVAVVWDGRFHVVLTGQDARECAVSPAVTVRALDLALYATLRRTLNPKLNLPARAAATLPAFWQGNQLLAVPGLGLAYHRLGWTADSPGRHADCKDDVQHGPACGFKAEFIYNGRACDLGV